MKRTPLRRYKPLKRTTPLQPGKLTSFGTSKASLQRLGKTKTKQKRSLTQYLKWRIQFLSANPHCQVRSSVCTVWAKEVHHVIKLSQGGARVPGRKADKQEQVFMASCRACNQRVEDHAKEARERGWCKSNPLMRSDQQPWKEPRDG